MNKLMGGGLASLMLLGAAVPAMTTPAQAGRGAGLFAGAIVGLTAGALITNAARADEYHRWRARCDRVAYDCHHGSDRACYLLDRDCR